MKDAWTKSDCSANTLVIIGVQISVYSYTINIAKKKLSNDGMYIVQQYWFRSSIIMLQTWIGAQWNDGASSLDL